jgi:DNA-binding SARP family transcriptional activator
MPQRQSLQADYLNLLNRLSHYYLGQKEHDSCVTMCDKFLAVDPCREEAHRRLMRCYVRRGQRYLALRQYQLCVETLQEEVDVSPTSATTALYEQIRQGRSV